MKYADITVPNIIEAFKRFNKQYFGDTLPMVTFRIKTTPKTLGQCAIQKTEHNVTITITISNYYLINETDFEQTLLHEMIHLKQYVDFGSMDHGVMFKLLAKTINEDSQHKYNISRCTSRLGYELSDEAKYRLEQQRDKKAKMQVLSVNW